MSGISGVRPAGIDNVFYVTLESKDMLSTLTRYPDSDTLAFEGAYYRLWSPSTSKLASMIMKGMDIPLGKNSKVLYLGAASGTTVTRVADIACDGIVFAVEFAPRPARDLLMAIEERINVMPIIADARQPERYPPFLNKVDVIYQDVAQPEQAAIANANAERYLKSGGYLIMAIKAKSISSIENVGDIFREELQTLGKDFQIMEKASLEPLHHGHLAVIARYK
ncbi:rRNA/tRNA 2'-O-methyltransferase [Methanocella paludicola SANAE]|uniref:Fibrillarin-like rRNA/tRNA 2'-O-methyltransferase n=1 Tax=Methanocella paludicola (strain DSM 17711 / JCM 13418 / NBRC 101707 / SANAE) TaxID=304371 RepID=D1YYV7_METPS|nr:fibrillarin-like rRNA/tRNA 2'-O-methyltransferase [Methanocella paludicola]BAI61629.1 rRNA/tRNA 2'-O-methyltransferase [Methanocella paludicola SANAE]